MLRLAVLGSTKGTDMQAIIDAIKNGELDAKIEIVISNKSDAYILDRGRGHGLETTFVDSKGKKREEYDREIINILEKYQIDLVLLIGYMRILSIPFVQKYKNKILNVHPSLLPAFAGGMDMDVHAEVIKTGAKETGCTIHLVDDGVDSGPIVLQKRCAVLPDDTADTLKTKVQKLEGEAFVEVLKNWKL